MEIQIVGAIDKLMSDLQGLATDTVKIALSNSNSVITYKAPVLRFILLHLL